MQVLAGRRNAVTSYCRLRGGKGHRKVVVRYADNPVCQRCGGEAEMPDHIMFRCRNIRRVKDKNKGGVTVRSPTRYAIPLDQN